MLFALGSLLPEEEEERFSAMRHDLRFHVAQNPGCWTGFMARITRTRAIQCPNSIEGIKVSQEDTLTGVDDGER